MTEQERLKILETNKPQSYFQATGLNPFAKPPLDRIGVEDYLKSIGRATTDFTGVKQLGENQFDISGVIPPVSLPTAETAGGLPENGLGIGGNIDYSSLLKDLSGGNIASSVNIEELVANQMAATQAELAKTRTQREENIKKQFEPLKEQVTEEGKKAIGGIQAVSARGGGLGASNIAEGMIRDQEKANKLVLADLEAKIVSAIASDDATKKKEYMDTYAQVIDQQDKLFNQKIKSSEIKLKAIDTLMGIKTAEAGITGYYDGKETLTREQIEKNYNIDLTKLGLDESQFNETMILNQSKFEEDKKQFGETQTLDKMKLNLQKSKDSSDSQLQFQTLLNNTPAGQRVEVILGDGTKLSGSGRFRYASEASGGSSILSDDDATFYPLLVQDEKTGEYAVSPDKIDLFISQKGVDRLTAFNKANALADKYNSERKEIQKQQLDKKEQTYKEQGLGYFGTGAKRRIDVPLEIGVEAFKQIYNLPENIYDTFWTGLFGD